jgi:hypothetical protein
MTFPGEGLIIKLWETLVEKGIGGFLKPWQAKREGLAKLDLRRAELVALADAERDAEDILAGRKRLDVVAGRYVLPASISQDSTPPLSTLPPLDPYPIIEISARRLISDGIRRDVNVAKAITHAESELKDDPHETPTRSMDNDWLFRWRDYAGEVSSEQLQILWGKLLAGEFKSPGSYSLRVLEFLKNLSPNEAADIARLSRFVVDGQIFRSQQAILDTEGVSINFLIDMEELGVIYNGVDSLGLNVTYKSDEPSRFIHELHSHGRVLIVTHEDPLKTLTLAVYKITNVCLDILKLGRFEPHELYLRKVGELIKGMGFSVSIANYQLMQILEEETL